MNLLDSEGGVWPKIITPILEQIFGTKTQRPIKGLRLLPKVLILALRKAREEWSGVVRAGRDQALFQPMQSGLNQRG